MEPTCYVFTLGTKRPMMRKPLRVLTPSQIAQSLLRKGWRVSNTTKNGSIHLAKDATETEGLKLAFVIANV